MHELAVGATKQGCMAVSVRDWNRRALNAAEAYRVYSQLGLHRCLRCRLHTLSEVLAVAEQHEQLTVGQLAGHSTRGDLDRTCKVSPADRDDARIERLKRLQEGRAVVRQRRLQKRIPRERDQTEAAAGQLFAQL